MSDKLSAFLSGKSLPIRRASIDSRILSLGADGIQELQEPMGVRTVHFPGGARANAERNPTDGLFIRLKFISEEIAVSPPRLNYETNLFSAAKTFQEHYDCEISDEDGVLSKKINKISSRLRSLRQIESLL